MYRKDYEEKIKNLEKKLKLLDEKDKSIDKLSKINLKLQNSLELISKQTQYTCIYFILIKK